MKTCAACKELKPEDQYGARVCHSSGRNPRCKPCVRASNKRAHEKYRSARRAAQKAWYESTGRYEAEKERYEANRKQWRANNLERENQKTSEWRKANPGKVTAYSAARRATERRATLPTVSREALIAIYERSEHLSQLTGVRHHVDHIVPLRGKTVCGLHVPWNLQCIPARDNLAKSNTY
jgi:hypothetical protein